MEMADAPRKPTCWRRTASGQWYKSYVPKSALPGLMEQDKVRALTNPPPKKDQLTEAADGPETA